MAFSIESRVPFLDHRLVEYAFSLATEDKVHETETKYILRKSLSGILPKAIEERKDKKGFVTPGESKWLRGPLKDLMDFNVKEMPFLHSEKISTLAENYKKGSNANSALIWRIAVLHYWMKNFL